MAHGYNPDNREARGIRQLCRTVACPRCGALPGAKCFGVRMKRRSASHVERWQAFDPNSIGARAQRKEKAMPDWDLVQGFGAEEGDPDHEIHDPAGHCGGQSFASAHRRREHPDAAWDPGLVFDGPARPRTKCNRCGSTDVRWRQQGGRWVLFSLQLGVEHACPGRSASADEFEVV